MVKKRMVIILCHLLILPVLVCAQSTYFDSNIFQKHKSIKFIKYVDVDGKGKWKSSGEYYIGCFSGQTKPNTKPYASWRFTKMNISASNSLFLTPWMVNTINETGEYLANIINGAEVLTFDIINTNEGMKIPIIDKKTGGLRTGQDAAPTTIHISYNKETHIFEGNGYEYYDWAGLPFFENPGDQAPPDTCSVKLNNHRLKSVG